MKFVARALVRDFDLIGKLWTVPGERTKTGKEHRVPLSAQVLEILKAAPRDDSDWVFIGTQKGKPMGTGSLDLVIKRLTPA